MKAIQCAHPPHHHRVLNKHKAKSIIQIYSDVMKKIQCAHPPHDRNGFVVTCRLWTASGPLVEHSVCHEPISVLINVFMLLA